MKLNFIKKIGMFFALTFGLVTLGACQSVDHSAYVDLNRSQIQVIEVAGTTNKIGRGTLTIVNNTIYATKSLTVAFKAYDSLLPTAEPKYVDAFEGNLASMHGSVITYYNEWAIQDSTILKVELCESAVSAGTTYKTEVTGYYSAWETYLSWWIVSFIVIAIAWIAYACTIFAKEISAKAAVDVLKHHMSTVLVCLLFATILALFPLIMGSWFPTIIMLIMFAGIILGFLGLTGIKELVSKNK